MVYRKSTRKYKRRRTRKSSIKKMRAIAQSVVNRNIEMKDREFLFTSVGYNDVTTIAESFTNIGYGNNSKICRLAAGLGQGIGGSDYVGIKFNIKGVHLHFAIGDPLLSTFASPAIRFIIFRPKGHSMPTAWSSNASFIQQLLSNTPSSGSQYLANIDTDAFKVYWQKTVYIPIHYNPASAGSVSYTPKIVNKFLKFPGSGLNVAWDEATSGLTNDVYIAAISSIGVAPFVNVIAGTVKLYYTDA